MLRKGAIFLTFLSPKHATEIRVVQLQRLPFSVLIHEYIGVQVDIAPISMWRHILTFSWVIRELNYADP